MSTPRKARILELRAELRQLEDEEDAPPITREQLKKLPPGEISRLFDQGDLDHLLGKRQEQPS